MSDNEPRSEPAQPAATPDDAQRAEAEPYAAPEQIAPAAPEPYAAPKSAFGSEPGAAAQPSPASGTAPEREPGAASEPAPEPSPPLSPSATADAAPEAPVPPPPYYPAGPHYWPSVQARTNAFAVAALVVGIVGLCFCFGILGMIFGYIARRQIAETGERGAGLATAGIVLGWIAAALVALRIIAIFAAGSGSSYGYY